jgi:hypothetical protein
MAGTLCVMLPLDVPRPSRHVCKQGEGSGLPLAHPWYGNGEVVPVEHDGGGRGDVLGTHRWW